MDTTGTKHTKKYLDAYGLALSGISPLFPLIRLSGNFQRALRCFFHGAVNIFKGLMEAAGRNPAAFNKFNNDFLGSSQYLFVHGCHVSAPLTRIRLSVSPTHLHYCRSGMALGRPAIALHPDLSGTSVLQDTYFSTMNLDCY